MHRPILRPVTRAAWRPSLIFGAACMALMLAGCGDNKEKGPSQTAVKVNKEEITVHQINFVLQQQRGLKPEQTDAASREILERLIDQEVSVQRAQEMKLDRDPRVVQMLEVARREVLARAYGERVAEAAAKPTAEEVQAYYEKMPALFEERRIYSLQEISIQANPQQYAELRDKLSAAKSPAEFVESLRAGQFQFSANQATRASEQLPLSSLEAIAKLRDGQAIISQTPFGAQVLLLVGSRMQPVTLERARPAIEQYLLNERKRELLAKNIKEARATAKIEYVGTFAKEPVGTTAQDPKSSAAPAAAPASSATLDAASIQKGLGLK